MLIPLLEMSYLPMGNLVPWFKDLKIYTHEDEKFSLLHSPSSQFLLSQPPCHLVLVSVYPSRVHSGIEKKEWIKSLSPLVYLKKKKKSLCYLAVCVFIGEIWIQLYPTSKLKISPHCQITVLTKEKLGKHLGFLPSCSSFQALLNPRALRLMMSAERILWN